ncbi:hypothetical protein F4780DRAFT_762793 [Xylariomycetidae sp. FL0641]|nr:hypothetical protein F4780DRAFT_762793 [Xylariomycetidae sp. FL0641]
MASYLYKWPRLCPRLSGTAATMLFRSLEILAQLEDKWSAVSEWISLLRRVAELPLNGAPEHRSEVSTQEALLNNTTLIGHLAETSRLPMTDTTQDRYRPSESYRSFTSMVAPTPERHVPGAASVTPQTSYERTRAERPGSLHVLSDAAAYGTYMYANDQDHGALKTSPAFQYHEVPSIRSQQEQIAAQQQPFSSEITSAALPLEFGHLCGYRTGLCAVRMAWVAAVEHCSKSSPP